MRTLVAGLLALLASAVQAQQIGFEGARHLLNRAGFGASDTEIRAFASLTRGEAVDRLLSGSRREPVLAPPAFVQEPFVPYYRIRDMNAEERMAQLRKRLTQGFELRAWWLHEMVLTPSPLTERMTLFWHNHFATALQKVRSVRLMHAQNELLRREALGSFRSLLHGIARDPAMLVYLDNAGSRREAPNENFAREVMELFTLGEGNYGERDVKEAARAFTGWSVNRDTGEFAYRRFWHDGGEKTVLGQTGRLDGAAVLDLLLAQPQTAEFVTAKLWREIVSPTPDRVEVRRIAKVFRDSGYEVKPLVRALLTADAFWSHDNRAALIKSPVDLVVGTLRTFGIRPLDYRPAAFAVGALGQNLMQPPNVKGWPGGEAWIDSSTLLGRRQWVDRVFRGVEAEMPVAQPMAASTSAGAATSPGQALRRSLESGMRGYAVDPERWVRSIDAGPGDRATRLATVVLAMPPANPIPGNEDEAAYVRALVSDPVFQLR